MSLNTLTLGERMVMATRFLVAEHVRQEVELAQTQSQQPRQSVNAHFSERAITPGSSSLRQDLFRQPVMASVGRDGDDDGRRAA